jgi:nucleoside-diphosphate-sugar epimerase
MAHERMKFSVFGSSGFIGSRLVQHLERLQHDVFAPARNWTIDDTHLGHVIYCIGLTADFRERPFDTVDAHVVRLVELLKRANFGSFLYLSSTRLYLGAGDTSEDTELVVNPAAPNDLYNISKLLGEAACWALSRSTVRIVRLSNVYGRAMSPQFLSMILNDAIKTRSVTLQTTMDSSKDYVSVNDVVALLPKIATEGRYRVYNVASGVNVSNSVILDRLIELTGCAVTVASEADALSFRPIRIEKIREEFNFHPIHLEDEIPRPYCCLRS